MQRLCTHSNQQALLYIAAEICNKVEKRKIQYGIDAPIAPINGYNVKVRLAVQFVRLDLRLHFVDIFRELIH